MIRWLILACLAWPGALAAYNQSTEFPQADIDSGAALKTLADQALGNIKQESRNLNTSTCRFETAQVRREWRDLSLDSRKEFTDAVQCLQNRPTNISAEAKKTFPGVQTRYDEFVATHINLTEYIHVNADFLAWHRYFIYTFEKALREECNYSSTLPYWEWGYDAEKPQDSVLFNGDAYSMGSNGEAWNRTTIFWASQNMTIPAGTGGGCVSAGPFANLTVNMGPINAPGEQPVDYKLEYNPRCLQRDVNPTVSGTSVAFRNSTELILSYETIDWFQGVMQADKRFTDPDAPRSFGVHGGGHLTVGGVLADIDTSPAEPMFWIHHAQIDRIWTIWQGLDPAKRRNAIWGTHTRADMPPSANMTLDEMLDFGFISTPREFATLMNPLAGPFCYYYE
ncbi:tyrosinase [Aspergillus heteromorphus CBS 117.55]|uniref:Tyrosinase n=1 Tax=Aspergillus heteromorphus CBS 117.55 TaxID=1448321 RepID=A0A317WKB9_9EURO|nr:tyrosinase [Aspergillus heteromorphus CBS 117.55]PWY86789.1 tyrosinase [Aspergillus heteromorphus CBS 117.55]